MRTDEPLYQPVVEPVPSATQDAAEAVQRGGRLIEVYQKTFDVIPATTEALRNEAFRLRYQVYCIEHPFEDPGSNPEGIETDEFDEHAAQNLLIHRATGRAAGTVRLVLPLADAPEQSFAIQRVCVDPIIADQRRFPITMMGEVSRFCVSKAFRRRKGDNAYADPDEAAVPANDKRFIPNMTLGLIESLVRTSVQQGVMWWCAVMEPSLLRLLARIGIYFEPIGTLVDYHGARQPCYQRLDLLLERVRKERREVWEVLTDDGAHWEALCAARESRGLAAA